MTWENHYMFKLNIKFIFHIKLIIGSCNINKKNDDIFLNEDDDISFDDNEDEIVEYDDKKT